MQRRLIADMAKTIGKPQVWVFMLALQANRGMASATLNEEAQEEHRRFTQSGCVPAYVEAYCLARLGRKKAKKTEPEAGSLVGALNDQDDGA